MNESARVRNAINPEQIRYSSPKNGEEIPDFSCDNENINRWFSNKGLHAHQHFDCRVTYTWLKNHDGLAAFYSICIKKEPQSDFAGHTFANRIFDEHRITTVHLKWLAVRTTLARKRIATIIMGRVVEDAYAIITKAGAHAVTVQYINAASEQLYRKVGFSNYGGSDQKKLYLPAEAVIDIVESID